MEIERKFLVKNIENLELDSFEHKQIIQDYLYVDKLTAIRKRKIVKNNEAKYVYTIKTGKKSFSVNEIEAEITEDTYVKLEPKSSYNQINKIRYIIPYIDGLKIELDVFLGQFEGIIFAEIEFENEEQAKDTKLPEWFGPEISSKITNSMMASMPIDEILSMINTIN